MLVLVLGSPEHAVWPASQMSILNQGNVLSTAESDANLTAEGCQSLHNASSQSLHLACLHTANSTTEQVDFWPKLWDIPMPSEARSRSNV